MLTEGQREQIKLRASYYNGIAVAIVAVGGLGFVLPLAGDNGREPWLIGVLSIAMITIVVISIVLREIAARSLLDLDKE